MRWDEWRGSMDGKPTLWIRRLVSWRGRRLDVHKMVAADGVGCFHTHPAYAIRIVLRGGYVEEVEGGRYRTWRPGMIGLVRPALSHRIAALRNGQFSVSIWLRFRHRAEVELRGSGWYQQTQPRRVVL